MTQISQSIPNINQIEEFLAELSEEFDLDNRLKRYQSMSPELIDLANNNGLKNSEQAAEALFIADFIITSSEVPSGITDEDRRISIIKAYLSGIKLQEENRTLLRIFYLTQKLYVALKRNDSFLAGRGIRSDSRKMMLLDLFIHPFLIKISELFQTDVLNWQIGLLHAILEQKLPDQIIDNYLNQPTITSDNENLFGTIWKVIDEFVTNHDAELNEDSPLPNVSSTGMIFQSQTNMVELAVSNVLQPPTEKSLDSNKTLHSFLDETDKDNALIYLRGDLINTDKHIMLTRNPYVSGKPLFICHSSLSDLNVTELVDLLAVKSHHVPGMVKTNLMLPIQKTIVETVTKQVREVKQVQVEEEVQVEVNSQDSENGEEKIGFFGRLKRKIFGSKSKKKSQDKNPEYETKKVKKMVDQEVLKNVKENVKRSKVNAHQLPEMVAYSLGIYALEDFRIFEEFDTLRESEYQVIGVLESDFKGDSTTLISTPGLENSNEVFDMLNGLDQVIEEVINYYFKGEYQLSPVEMLFINKEQQLFLLCLAGDDDRLVASIARSYEKDITNWQSKDVVEPVQRRTLHMRTGQLLSARQHTPFDRACERIYADSIGQDTKISQLKQAILSIME